MSADAASRAPHEPHLAPFLARWSQAGSAERANYAHFLTELYDVLKPPRSKPALLTDPTSAAANDPRFRKAWLSGQSKIQNRKSRIPWPKPLVALGRAREGDTKHTFVR